MNAPNAPGRALFDAHGRRVVKDSTANCPRCGASPKKRVRSSSFGDPHDVCENCGYEWPTLTLSEEGSHGDR